MELFLCEEANSYGKLKPPLLVDEHILTLDHLCWDMLDLEQFRYSLSHTFNMPGLVGQPTFGDMDESLETEPSKSNSLNPPDDEVILPGNMFGLTTNVDIFNMPAPNIRFEQQIHNKTKAKPHSWWMYLTRSPLKQHFMAKIVRPSKDELPLCPTGDSPPKLIPLFSSADSEDEDDSGESKFISDHEDDLLPTILQRKAMAEAKSAQEELVPVNPHPLPALMTAETTSWENLMKGTMVEGKEQINVNVVSNAPLLSPVLDAAVAHLNSSDHTERPSIVEKNPSLDSASSLKIQSVANDMEVDPEDDILDYGMSDNEIQPADPVNTMIPTAETLIATEVAPQLLTLEEGGTSNLNKDSP
ncbi:hypothetical protein DXG01_010278 [Tephrocybe rancida]|nr:hypothetical protein DXG01_010278 [Tephrocybe rancida]